MEGIVSPVSRESDDVVSFYFGLLQVKYLINSCTEGLLFSDCLVWLRLNLKDN